MENEVITADKKRLLGNSISTWLLIAFIVLSVIGGNSYLAINTIKDLTSVQRELYKTSETMIALNNLHVSVLSAETGQRGYLLTENEDYLKPYQRGLSSVIEQMKVVANLELHGKEHVENIQLLIDLTNQKMDELQNTVELGLKDKEKSAIKIIMTGRGKDLYRAMFEVINQIVKTEVLYRDKLYSELVKIQKEAVITFLISGITSALLLIGMVVLARLNLNNENKLRQILQQQNESLAEQVAIRTQELTIYSEELSRSNRELEDFAFVASHDLQEPLRKIRAFGDRLMSSYGDELEGKGADYISRMKSAAERMSNLINDLLEFSRVTTKGKDFVDVDLNQLINEVLTDLEIAIEESQAKITVEPIPQSKGDEGQMYQLFLNLLSNAIKFRKADIPPKISLAYKSDEVVDPLTGQSVSWHVLTLSDNGIGFEQEFADKIFVPFQRLHGRKDYKGTGIGLAVCRRIVERHGGTIEAESVLNQGTVFTIKIPANATLFNNQGITTNA
ncbi:ATP-binding protein [Paraglaciecola sp. L3A3]|uniref:sensor histidine kinase n=1 Tax=Paraglaciecola sp. L3A3 TaxID=2686358 RepID=UPI00131B7BCA|nr:sensor histidine kinase [Paraglaciecola sp. L3A3]